LASPTGADAGMKQVDIHEVEPQLSRLIEEVKAGGEVVIAQYPVTV
jgi:antitoxin (DNA-binding transcriptional repressor) of toxin-antitoxin stability system